MPSYSFKAFGLCISSNLDLSGAAAGCAESDLAVEVRVARAGWRAEGDVKPVTRFWGAGNRPFESVAEIPGVARFRARKGRHVLIEHEPTLSSGDVRGIAISTAVPLALQQRQGLLLEASAIRWRDRVLLLVGQGPCGKSSLAALMADVGAQLLADSHCMIRLGSDGLLKLEPAFPHVRLWPSEAAELSGAWPDPVRVREGLEKLLFVVPERYLQVGARIDGWLNLRRGVDSGFHFRKLNGAEALQALAPCADRLCPPVTPDTLGLRFRLLGAMAALPICHLLQWPRGGRPVAETRDRLVDVLDASCGSGAA